MEFSSLNGYKVKDKKAVRFYGNVATMKSDTSLKDGMIVKTTGFYSFNDGGDSYYKIRTTTINDVIDEMFIISLYDDLVAELLIGNNEINVKQVGLTGEQNEDATEKLSIIFASGYDVYFPSGIYNVNDTLNLLSTKIRGNIKGDSIIKLSSNINKQLIYSDSLSNVLIDHIKFDLGELTDTLQSNINLFNTNGLTITNSEFVGGYGTQLRINGSNDVLIENCYFHNVGGDDTNPGEAIYYNGGNNCLIKNCKSDYLHDHFLYLDGSNSHQNITVRNCYIKRSGHDMVAENGAGIAVYGNCIDVIIEDNIFDSCRNGINVAIRNNIKPKNIFINKNHVFNSQQDGIYGEGENLFITDNIINDNGYNGLNLRNGENYYINNNTCFNNESTGLNVRNGSYIFINNNSFYNNKSSGVTIGYNVSNVCNHVKISNCIAYATEGKVQLSGFQILNSDDVVITTCKSFNNTYNYDTQRSISLNLVSQLNTDRETNINSLMYKSAIPSSGSYNVGDTILYTNPTANGYIGAVCVVAGAPGTWKNFGSISS